MLNLAKVTLANSYASQVSEEICNAIDYLVYGDNDEAPLVQAYDSVVAILGHAGEFSISNVNGAQLRARLINEEEGVSTLSLFTLNSQGQEVVIRKWRRSPFNVQTLQKSDINNIPLFNGESFRSNWDAILDNAISTSANNQCLMDIVRQSQADGEIKVSQVKDICEKYSPTELITGILDQVRGLNSLNYTSVLGVVGQALSKGQGSYNEGQDYYSPYNSPEYCNDVLGVIVSLVVSAIPVILSVVFKSIGAILSVIGIMVQSILSLITENITKTSAKIVKNSDLPVWNFPVGLWTLSELSVLDNLELKDIIDNFGCALEVNPLTDELSLHSLVRWILPTGQNNQYICQMLPLATMPIVSAYRDASISETDDAVPTINFEGTGESDSVYSYPEDMAEYVSYSDAKLCNALFTNVMLSYGSYGGYVRRVSKSIQRPANMRSVKSWLAAIDAVSGLNDRQKVAFAYGVLRLLSTKESFDSITTDYDNVYALLTWQPFIRSVSLSDEYFFKADRVFFPGNDVVTPAVNFPNLSRSSLIQALLITSLTAVVTAGAAFGYRKWRKRKAVARLTLSEKRFADAQEAYKKNPTTANATQLEKANRKLSRSWKKAGKTGVNMYNGFDTGSSEPVVNTSSLANGAAYAYQNDLSLAMTKVETLISGF